MNSNVRSLYDRWIDFDGGTPHGASALLEFAPWVQGDTERSRECNLGWLLAKTPVREYRGYRLGGDRRNGRCKWRLDKVAGE
jgi:hypothetical protein